MIIKFFCFLRLHCEWRMKDRWKYCTEYWQCKIDRTNLARHSRWSLIFRVCPSRSVFSLLLLLPRSTAVELGYLELKSIPLGHSFSVTYYQLSRTPTIVSPLTSEFEMAPEFSLLFSSALQPREVGVQPLSIALYPSVSLRWFLSITLRIPTAHDFRVISARKLARARTDNERNFLQA